MLAGLTATALTLGACAQGPASRTPAPLPQDDIDFVRPALRGAENGLEMHWWVVEGPPEPLRRALSVYAADDCGACPATRERLAGSGLRLVRVPLEELTAIRSQLEVRGRTDRKWLGQAPWWIEALRGALTGEAVIHKNGRTLTLPSGRLRVLARAWTAPASDGPVMRADVAIQHMPRLTELLPSLTQGDARRSLEPQRQGPIFEETMASLEMRRGYAYLLVCDEPEAQWTESAETVDPLLLAYAPPAPDDDLMGPPTVPVPTVGERLLRRPGTPLTSERPMTAVVVLAPRLPDRFTLLP
jgi:hypothetical protein